MTNNIVAFPPKPVPLRACPGCGFVSTQFEIEYARYDFMCPRCEKHPMSDFYRTTLTLEKK